MTDQEIAATMRRTMDHMSEVVAEEMVNTHLAKVPNLQIAMGICMNPGRRPWENNEGVKLVEICKGLPAEPDASFDYSVFPPDRGWPRLKIMLISLGTLNIKLAPGKQGSFYEKLKTELGNGTVKCVFPPKSGVDAIAYLDDLLGPAEPE